MCLRFEYKFKYRKADLYIWSQIILFSPPSLIYVSFADGVYKLWEGGQLPVPHFCNHHIRVCRLCCWTTLRTWENQRLDLNYMVQASWFRFFECRMNVYEGKRAWIQILSDWNQPSFMCGNELDESNICQCSCHCESFVTDNADGCCNVQPLIRASLLKMQIVSILLYWSLTCMM